MTDSVCWQHEFQSAVKELDVAGARNAELKQLVRLAADKAAETKHMRQVEEAVAEYQLQLGRTVAANLDCVTAGDEQEKFKTEVIAGYQLMRSLPLVHCHCCAAIAVMSLLHCHC